YGRWMGFLHQTDGSFSGVLQGNLGWSYWQKISVLELVGGALPTTFQLGFMGLVIANLMAIPIGVYSALRQDKWGDYIARSYAILCISIPGFWLATLVIVFPAMWWGFMPSIMLIHFTEDPVGNLGMFIIPAIVLGMSGQGMNMRITRTMMLEVLRQDYIRTAWAKGLRERVVVLRHALKNALIPIISTVGLGIPVLIGGTVIIENIFCLPGMGRLMFCAIKERDKLVVCGVVVVYAFMLILTNLIVDLTYSYLDPRIRYK
ncbi:MAG TPA: ABC transporter permease, partial [Dehalococcoidales bacterium]|nr:ABC transporter permease [Dehalococcoidales bacterium]